MEWKIIEPSFLELVFYNTPLLHSNKMCTTVISSTVAHLAVIKKGFGSTLFKKENHLPCAVSFFVVYQQVQHNLPIFQHVEDIVLQHQKEVFGLLVWHLLQRLQTVQHLTVSLSGSLKLWLWCRRAHIVKYRKSQRVEWDPCMCDPRCGWSVIRAAVPDGRQNRQKWPPVFSGPLNNAISGKSYCRAPPAGRA